MKYYLIVGEASGDLHASRLMASLRQYDPQAEFRFFGGDPMSAVGGERVRHYKDLAYMGFVPVLLHLRTIFRNMKWCKEDIVAWKPDMVVLVDYPGFNLDIAKYVHKHTQIPVYYYISPKIWAWKEWRIKSIRRDVSEMFSILPFEVDFYKKHQYPIHYVGNPTAEEVMQFRNTYQESREDFLMRYGLSDKPIIALLAGSRKQEIKDNLPAMIEAARHFKDYQMVIAGAPSIARDYYNKVLGQDQHVPLVDNETYALLTHSVAALVTSGTATLETCLLGVPQVVCYKTPVPALTRWGFDHILKVDYISLVNLVADREVVKELFADQFTIYRIMNELYRVLPGHPHREEMLRGYRTVADRLGRSVAPDEAARLMIGLLLARQSAAAPPPEPSVSPATAAPATPGEASALPSEAPQTASTVPTAPAEEEPEEEYEVVSVKQPE